MKKTHHFNGWRVWRRGGRADEPWQARHKDGTYVNFGDESLTVDQIKKILSDPEIVRMWQERTRTELAALSSGNMKHHLLIWDWKDQPEWVLINSCLRDFKSPKITEVETGSDDFAIIIQEISDPRSAQELFAKEMKEMTESEMESE